MEYVKYVLIAFFFFILGFAIADTGPTTEVVEQVEATPTPAQETSDGVLNTFGENFVVGCIDEGGNTEFCTCAYNYLDENMTDAEMLELSIETLQDEDYISDEMIEAVKACLHLY